jgi:protocatechuate 3,4-dioxygenase alpha subunit
MPTSPYCTIGPFFPGDFVTGCEDLTSFQGKQARGQHILLTGRVVEEGSRPILNAIVEIWQPDANGVFRHPLDPRVQDADPGFFGWGRARTDVEGRYSFRTVLPGGTSVKGPGNGYGDAQLRCPHLNLMILAIGLTRRLVTTVFFGEAFDTVRDPVLDCVADPAARARMFARRENDRNAAAGVPVYRYDIVTRGEAETPFFLD